MFDSLALSSFLAVKALRARILSLMPLRKELGEGATTPSVVSPSSHSPFWSCCFWHLTRRVLDTTNPGRKSNSSLWYPEFEKLVWLVVNSMYQVERYMITTLMTRLKSLQISTTSHSYDFYCILLLVENSTQERTKRKLPTQSSFKKCYYLRLQNIVSL